MKIQIYSHKTREDVTTSVDLGVNFIGVATGELGRLPDEVPHAMCRSIFSAIPTESHVSKVALTVASELDEIMETIAMTSPDVIHLSGDISSMSVQNVAELRSAAPDTKIMQAIPVRDDTSINLALEYQFVSDYIILDTDIESYTGVGATGSTHDWNVSRKIVAAVNIPVILAGGLSPANVADAINLVRPWCVDSFTHTNKTNSKFKDPDKIQQFITSARNWSQT